MNRSTQVTIFVAIQIIAVFGFAQAKQFDYIYETLIIIAGAFLLTYLEIKKNLPISNYLRIVVFIAISGHTIGGELMNLYGISTIYDKYLHVFGAYSFAILGYVLLGMYNLSLPPKVKFIMIITIGLSVGTIYELIEFAIDQFSTPTLPAQSGLIDTNLDLLADLLCSIVAATHLSMKTYYPLKDQP